MDFAASRVPPPATSNWATRYCFSETRNGSACRLQDQTVTSNEGQRLRGAHVTLDAPRHFTQIGLFSAAHFPPR